MSNRQHLYRGKCKDNGEWVEGYFVETHRPIYRAFIIKNIDIDVDNCGMTILDSAIHEVISETVCECTGLEDKNGVKIFEDDVVKEDEDMFVIKFGKCGGVVNCENYGYMGFYLVPVDKHTKRCMDFGLRNDIYFYTDLSVIGNIHDNPELLEV